MSGTGEAAVEAALNVRWVASGEVRARWEAASVRLKVRIGAEPEIADARVRLAFPVTRPDRLVEISDAKGDAVCVLDSLEGLDPESLRALRAALETRYMVPVVTRLYELTEMSPFVLRWRVDTNRGPRVYFTESPREAVRYLVDERVRVTDLAGNHFDFPRPSALDAASCGILNAFL